MFPLSQPHLRMPIIRAFFKTRSGRVYTRAGWHDAINDADMRRLARAMARGDYERAKRRVWHREFVAAVWQDASDGGYGYYEFAKNAWVV